MTAAFGPPAPLPGQPGYRARPSEAMAVETAEMEERLSRLKTDLMVQAEEREAAGPRIGGSRWRSARTDRGSVRAYAKDVKSRHQEQLRQRPPHGIFASGGVGVGGAGARAAAVLREEPHHRQRRRVQAERGEDSGALRPSKSEQDSSVRLGFADKEVSRWSVRDTLEWLDSGLGLGIHRGVFQQNEISGPILLEVGLDDLDYMNVHVLAHRKRILKGIEDLRRGNVGQGADIPPPPAPAPALPGERNDGWTRAQTDDKGATSVKDGSIRQEGVVQNPKTTRKKHWSHIPPLSNNQTEDTGDPEGGEPSANLADGQYDEAAARSSFSDAVKTWRGEGCESKHAASSNQPATIYRAPMTGSLGAETATVAEGSTGDGGLGKHRGGLLGSTTECWTNPFASPRLSEIKASPPVKGSHLVEVESQRGSHPHLSTATEVLTGPGGRHAEGAPPTLDEEAEHEAFRRAVAEWNSGRKAAGEGGADDGMCRRPGLTTQSAEAAPRRTAEMVAEALRDQMDVEHRAQARELEEKKLGLLKGIETARREKNVVASVRAGGEVEHDSCEEESKGGGSVVTGVSRAIPGGLEINDWSDRGGEEKETRRGEDTDRDEWYDEGSKSLSSASGHLCAAALRKSEDEESRSVDSGCAESGGGVEIVFLGSVLGADLSAGEGISYLVDEGESSGSDRL